MPKVNLMKKYRVHPDDTGSVEVQIILITEKVNDLAKHLKEHNKDNDSRLGLIKLVGKRRRLLNYLKKQDQDEEKYQELISDLKLRK